MFKNSNHPQHKGSAASGGRSNGYAIGYGKPPPHSRFRPGQSGHPAGRPKAVRNLSTDVKRVLKTPVKVNEGGRARKISTQEGALLVLREKALKGDARALDRLLELASRYNNDAGGMGAQELGADDQAILAAYADEILSNRATTAIESPGSSPPHMRAGAAESLARLLTKPGEPSKRSKLHSRVKLSRDDEADK